MRDGFAWLVRVAAWLAGCGLLALLLASGIATRADNALYDLNMRHWGYAAGDDVVIVAIDQKSLDALGHWPWPRDVHARLLDRLAADGVRAVGLDVIMTDADDAHPQNDRALAAAVRREGHVAMPVFAEPGELHGPLQEMLPIPALTQAAAALGHVDTPNGPDGVTRGAYLDAGLGRAYWPSLALALDRVGGGAGRDTALPGLRNPEPSDASPYLWVRDHYVLLRYAGPVGSFGQVSYVDVLDGKLPTGLLKDRLVLVGATAEGMRDILHTPVGLMPGVEYQANLLESLRRGLLVTPLGFTGQFLAGIVVLALACLLYGWPGMRRAWRAALAGLSLAPVAALLLLRLAGLWWPPATCMLLFAAALAVTGLVPRRLRRRRPA
ncbi:CHASE2 domain-containing protein [Fulvimonas sp. R45]|jgi:CHASE2 domain-containing sensor protein|uniref:CHASE2 domain-containing protein n=1 Tax=Fulvimonas sp. R45 TaxID=3045937 RepID=UPI00265EFD3F|nr:CHASE2 domain-containing protein [Fulvimonas sp. R45]MDO1529688.1 CHASE2 domain-containing protein [Fulvimonas sp. R45]